MTDQWETLKDLFATALNLSGKQREEFLSGVNAQNPALHVQLKRLLEQHDAAGTRLQVDPTISMGTFLPGQTVAERYRVVRQLGRGGMGEVYEAFDTVLNEKIALKTVQQNVTLDGDIGTRLIQELQLARKITHQSVCRVYDIGYHTENSGPIIFFTMELLHGETLAMRVSRDGRLTPEGALDIARRIADGIDAAHTCGIVHRDLKPANIMLTKNGRIVILDFGLARDSEHGSAVPSAGSDSRESRIFGTPGYISPEQAAGRRATRASDIYSFGVVLHEMVTGRKPTDDKGQTAASGLNVYPDPVWNNVIRRCLELRPEDRFQTAAHVIRALDQTISITVDTEPSPLIAKIPTKREPRFNPKNISRRAAILAIGAVPAAAAAVTVAALAGRGMNFQIDAFQVDNQTGQPDLDYLCRGTTTELIRRLSNVSGVQVFPMYSTRSSTPPHEQNRFFLDGILQKHGGQIRLTMSLTDNVARRVVWSENFERDSIGNPLQLQSEIAEGIVSGMERQVLRSGFAGELAPVSEMAAYVRRAFGTSAAGQLPEKPTRSTVAWDHYMRGSTLRFEEAPASAPQAVRAFELAIQEDPGFALAYAEMARAQAALINFNIVPDLDVAESARRAVEKAVELDPQLPEAFVSLGIVRFLEWDWTGAEQSFHEALRLRPGFSPANLWLAGLVVRFARFGEAIAASRAAIQADPHNSSTLAGCGLYIFFSGVYREALAVLEPAVQGKELPGVRHNLGQLYARLGQLARGAESDEWFNKAFVEAQTVQEIELRTAPPDSRWPHLLADRMFGLFHAMRGDRERAQPYFERLVDSMHSRRTSPVVVSWIPAQFGDTREALDLLDLAMTYRDRRLSLIRVYPFLERLHGEPRFESLLKQLRLV